MTYSYNPPDDVRFHQMLVTYLETQKRHELAALLMNVRVEVNTSGVFSHVRWDGFATTLRLTVPIARLSTYTDDVKRELLVIASS